MIDFKTETVLTLAGAAKRLGISVKTVRAWSKRVSGRKLETAKLGGKRFTSLEAIQRFSLQSATDSRSTRQKRHPAKGQRLIELNE